MKLLSCFVTAILLTHPGAAGIVRMDEGAGESDKGRYEADAELAEDTVLLGLAGGDPTTVADDHEDPQQQTSEPATPSLPVGAGPVGEQRAAPDFGRDLPDCGAEATEQVSCWDPATWESYWVLPSDEDDSDDDAAGDADGPAVVTGAELSAAVREYVRVRIEPAPVVLQPDQDWHLVNLPVIVRTEPAVQQFATDLLGLPVQIRAEPVSYSWDFGDGSPVLNTTEVGAAYPDHTIEHTYTEAGEHQITLIAYWSGSFRVGEGPWIEIDGLGVTASTTPMLDLQTRTTRLTG